jgi:hypothetical protein
MYTVKKVGGCFVFRGPNGLKLTNSNFETLLAEATKDKLTMPKTTLEKITNAFDQAAKKYLGK